MSSGDPPRHGWSHLSPEDSVAKGEEPQPEANGWPSAPAPSPAPAPQAPAPQAPAPQAPAPQAPVPQAQPRAAQAPMPQPPQQPQQPVPQRQPQVPARAQAQAPAGSVAHPQADEVLFQGVCLHSAAVGPYSFWFLMSILGGALAWALGHIEFMATLPLWVLGFVGFPGVLYTFLRHISTKYKVSRKRIEYERGILSKQVDSLELWRVLDVKYQQNLIDRIFGNAKITLIGTDQTDPELVLYGMPNHRKLFEELREAVQAARHTSRPMELVGQDGLGEGLEAL